MPDKNSILHLPNEPLAIIIKELPVDTGSNLDKILAALASYEQLERRTALQPFSRTGDKMKELLVIYNILATVHP